MFSTDGRINRLKYFIYSACFGIFAGFAQELLTVAVYDDVNANAVIRFVCYIVYGFVLTCLSVRRFHDLNKQGSWAWLMFLPLASLLLFLYLTFAKGTVGANKYGEDPLEK